MARTLKQYKENRKRRLAAKPQRTIVPHMQVVVDEDIHLLVDDFQPPPHTPPAMDPLTVCPFAPVKPKELTIIQDFSLASAIFFN
jgi:hypothetical protein